MAIVYQSKYSGYFCDKYGNNVNIDLKHRTTVADSGVIIVPLAKHIIFTGHDESPVTISYKSVDDDYKLNPINGSECKLNIMADENFDLSALYTADEKEWMLVISGTWDWSGYVIPDSCSEPFAAKPYPVTISATDGLGLLKDIPFTNDDGTKYKGFNSDRNILKVALAKTQLSLPMAIGVNTYDYTMAVQLTPVDPLDLTFIDQSRFIDQDGNAFSCEEVIRSICAKWSARLHQFGGKWQIVNGLELALGKVTAYNYNATGDYLGYSELTNKITAGGLNRDIQPVGNTQLAKAFKQSIGYYQYGYIANQLFNGDMDLWTSKPNGLPDGWVTFGSTTVTATTRIRQNNGVDTTDYNIQIMDVGQGGLQNQNLVQIRANETTQVTFDLYAPNALNGSSNANSYISVLIQSDGNKWFTNTGWQTTYGYYVISKNKTDYINQISVNFNVDPQPFDYKITFGVLPVGDANGSHWYTSINNVSVKPTSDSATKPAIGSFTKLESLSQQSYKPEPILLLHSDDRNEQRTSLINIGSANSGSHPSNWYRSVLPTEIKTLLEIVADTELRLHSRPYRIFEATFYGYDEIDINTLLTVDLITGNFIFLSGDFDLKTGNHNLRFAEALTSSISYVETTAQDYGEINDKNSVGSPAGIGSTQTSSYVDNSQFARISQVPVKATNVETQTGTDDAKYISPFNLANWWSWIKTTAQTISGAWNFTTRPTFNGAGLLTAESDTLATASTRGNITPNTLFVTGAVRPISVPVGVAVYMQVNADGTGVLEAFNYTNIGGAPLLLNPNGGSVRVATAPVGNTDVIRKIDLATGVLSSAATLTMSVANEHHVFNGSTATWTAPVIAGNTWRRIFLKNRGGGILTLNAAGGSATLYVTSAVSSVSLNPGDAIILINDGTYWLIN